MGMEFSGGRRKGGLSFEETERNQNNDGTAHNAKKPGLHPYARGKHLEF
jgi:hypothetical protein